MTDGLRQCPGCRLICRDPEEFPVNKLVCIHCVQSMNKTVGG